MIHGSAGQVGQIGTIVGNPTTLAMSVASARTAALKPKTAYRLWSSVDAFFVFGAAGVIDATTSSNPIKAGVSEVFVTDDANLAVAAILAAGTGTLYISQMAL